MHRILVVEDYPDNMALVQEILEDEGYEVVTSVTAEEGIACLQDQAVSLILMDVSLPKMSGLDATRHIKEVLMVTDIPIVALTAHAMDADREAAFAAGCDGFLTKPIDEALLVETLSTFLE